jgi:hypothetical protein
MVICLGAAAAIGVFMGRGVQSASFMISQVAKAPGNVNVRNAGILWT